MPTLWFCEDAKHNIRSFNSVPTPEGVKAFVLRTIAAVDKALELMSDGDVVSIDSLMPAQEGASKNPQAGEIIAAKVLDAGKRVHLVWHSKTEPLPSRLRPWSVKEQPNVVALKNLALELQSSAPPPVKPEAARAARDFLAGFELDLPLMILWVLCEGYVGVDPKYRVDPRNWFGPLREAIESKPEDWQWDAWRRAAVGEGSSTRPDAPVRRLVERLLAETEDEQEGSWDTEVGAAHEVLKERFL